MGVFLCKWMLCITSVHCICEIITGVECFFHVWIFHTWTFYSLIYNYCKLRLTSTTAVQLETMHICEIAVIIHMLEKGQSLQTSCSWKSCLEFSFPHFFMLHCKIMKTNEYYLDQCSRFILMNFIIWFAGRLDRLDLSHLMHCGNNYAVYDGESD